MFILGYKYRDNKKNNRLTKKKGHHIVWGSNIPDFQMKKVILAPVVPRNSLVNCIMHVLFCKIDFLAKIIVTICI